MEDYVQSTDTAELLSQIPSLNNSNNATMMVYMYRLEILHRSSLPFTEPVGTVDKVDHILDTEPFLRAEGETENLWNTNGKLKSIYLQYLGSHRQKRKSIL